MKMRRIVCGVLVAVSMLQASGASAASDFEKAGPYPVGVTTTVFVDQDRHDNATKGPRTTMTEIWYPTTELGTKFPKNKFSDFMLKGSHPGISMAIKMAFKMDIAELDKTFENEAFRDAPVADGKFPLIIFSHGNGGFRMQNVFWCEHLASHGYIVVAPDHTGNAAATVVDNKLIIHDSKAREQAAIDRPLDVRFLIDMMGKWNQGADSRFNGKLDMEKIGVGGHSFGGMTSTMAADQDDRIDAIVPMAAVGREHKNTDVPSLIILATEDDTIGARGNDRVREYYDEGTGPKILVEFVDGGHYSFTEMFQFDSKFGDGVGTGKRITNGEDITYTDKETVYQYTNGYSLAFLNKYVKGESSKAIDAYLGKNQNKSVLIHKASGE
ncbi:alpha/beta fold hydrolase [bacterium AH-315-P07]|nr:alpha/beta fold hydrolase [bacterium AH-315-P07]